MMIDDARATFLAEFLGECKDKNRALGFLEDFAKDPSPLVREGAILGLANLDTADARMVLQRIANNEKEKETLREMARECLEPTV